LRFVHRTLAIVALTIVALRGFALDPQRALTQTRLSTWTTEAGLPQSTIDAIVQTRDGYLWLGTEEGLVRFDGLRFKVTDRKNAPALSSAFVSALFEARDGALWIGTYGGGLARLRNGVVEAFHPELLGSDRVRAIHATPDGVMFLATAGGGLVRIEGERVTRFTTRDGLPSDRIWALTDDGAGGLWVATHGGGVVQWRDGKAQRAISAKNGLPSDLARTLLRDADGTLWIGTDGGGLAAWKDGAISRKLTTRDGLPSDFIRVLARDRDGSLWIGTDGGVARWRGLATEVLHVDNGLPSPVIRTILEDREGNLWVGTTGGLVRLRDTRFLPFTRREGLPVDSVRAILEGGDQRIWVGTEGGGLCEITRSALRCRTTRDGLPHDSIYTLAPGRDGLWVGTDGGGVLRLRDDRIVESIDARRSGLPNDRVRALVETANGLWVSTTAGLALVRGGHANRVKELEDRQLRPLLALPDGNLLVGTDGAGLWRVAADGSSAALVARAGRGLQSDRVFTLASDAEGDGVWIGTSGGGLSRLDLKSGVVKTVTTREGLFDDVVFQVIDTGRGGDLWMTSNRGLYRVARERVLRAMAGERVDLSGRVYGTADGMPSAECNAASPAAIRARDGRLWVGTARGIAVVDPAAADPNTVPPPVHVEEVFLDGVAAGASSGGSIRIPPGTRRIEVHYTGLSLRSPERVTFRYLLDGYDVNWIDAGTNRVAHYTRLAPGTYDFRVMATNEDGVRSQGDARLALIVEPRWFETWWARLAALLLIAALLWGGVQLRLAALRARKNEELARMAAKLEDTNHQLAIANDRLQGLSYMDGLTGVANRRRFDETLADACVVASERGTSLSLILLDLDHFKILNDTRGHQAGDEALRAVGSMLAHSTASRGGLGARVGGEEFAWLLPGVSLDAARMEAELLRIRIREAAIPHDGTESRVVTASFGISSSTDANVRPLELFAAADAALYRAKETGRDRVETEAME
jgi:diguanylate cyclase (GGDEF)-like protein